MTELDPKQPQDESWERELLNRLAFATLNEQRRTRRWGYFFKMLFLLYLFALLVPLYPNLVGSIPHVVGNEEYTALIEVNGVIAPDTEASADNVVSSLRAAFDDENVAGIILRINSPGGSPVQSGYIYDEIRRLKEKNSDKSVYAVVADLCASGGYYIASAADEIYVDQASIVGSIGVLMNGFGFVDAIDKLGIERRLLTAGENKGFLDPFSPMKERDVAHVKTLLDDIHQQFINNVKQGRGDRLKVDENPDLFSGLMWTGKQAVELGLADGLGSSSYVARELIEAEEIKDFTKRPDYFERFAEGLGAAIANTLAQQLQITQQLIQ